MKEWRYYIVIKSNIILNLKQIIDDKKQQKVGVLDNRPKDIYNSRFENASL